MTFSHFFRTTFRETCTCSYCALEWVCELSSCTGQFSYFPFVAISQPCSRLQDGKSTEVWNPVICHPRHLYNYGCSHLLSMSPYLYVCVCVRRERVRLIDRCFFTHFHIIRNIQGTYFVCVYKMCEMSFSPFHTHHFTPVGFIQEEHQ